MTGGFLDGDIFRGLAFKILLFLTLALLPLGLISVFQTRETAKQIANNAELFLVGLTNQAVSEERLVLQEAFGAARALNTLGPFVRNGQGNCEEFLSVLDAGPGFYGFVANVSSNGELLCATHQKAKGAFNLPGVAGHPGPPERIVKAWHPVARNAVPLLVVAQPYERAGAFAGYVLLGVPLEKMIHGIVDPLPDELLGVITFNNAGEVVGASGSFEELGSTLPWDRDLTDFAVQRSQVFRAEAVGGEELLYAVVPIVPNVAYSMSIWDPDDLGSGLAQRLGLNIFLPVLMWVASLIVAFWALNRLAVRHIRKLGRQMRHFAYNRQVPRNVLGQGVPRELVDIQAAFVRMAESIIRDEAALEDSLRDKNILLKEVHHRVKNNLQLVSSIMNMQIRRAQSEDARFVLRRLQDRILSLATVHKNLYQTNELDRVDAGKLLEEIIGQLLAVGLPTGVDVNQNYVSVEMDADDAAPFTLLVSEAVTNALKYLDKPADGQDAQLDIGFEPTDDGGAIFRISNTTSGASGSEGTGLGTQLIDAFARQLNGEVEVDFRDNRHALQITFPLRKRTPERYDF